ncbi:MAG: HD domain-containing protein [Vicinamibacteria bacterium]|nr:HD domain-containing protein [Vicinamibacteria bacterium]
MKIQFLALALFGAAPAFVLAQTPSPATTPAGIPLDAPWKEAVFKFSNEKLQHSAWGVSHSERDYLLAARLAAESKLTIDTDVLFAAAFLHDVGAFDAFRKDGVDHTDRAAELVPEILVGAGFPAAKVPAVQDAVKNHMYYRADAGGPEAIVLHDADTLDFLGSVGIARIFSLTTRHRWATDLGVAVKTIEGFNADLPAKLMTNAAKKLAPARVAESRAFLESLRGETEEGRAR